MSTPTPQVPGVTPDWYGKSKKTFKKTVKKVGGATASGPQPLGSMGSFPVYGTPDKGHGTAKKPIVYLGAGAPIAFASQGAATAMYYQWDSKTKNKFLSQISLAGFDTGELKDAQLAALWAGYVDTAAKYSLAGKWVSPWEVMGKDIAQREVAAATPRTVTQTQKAYNISTAEDAHALFQGAAQTLLGRDPTKSEIARFKSVLNKYEETRPTVTTTTSQYLGSELQSQESKTTGGVSAASQQLMAQEEAKKNPEYGAYQAATNGMNWLMEMIGGG